MRFFSFNKNQVAVLATLLILLVFGAVYFFIYVPQNEKTLQAQRFRALQNIDRNVHAKIDNSVSLLNNILTPYVKGTQEERSNLQKYISGYSKANFTLSLPKQIPAAKSIMEDSSQTADSSYRLKVNNDTRQVRLLFNKRFIVDGRDVIYEMGMEFSYTQFFSLLLPREIFDEYIVFRNEEPVYETFPAGISHFQKDTLLGIRNGVVGSGIRTYTVGGVEYKFFLQPVKIISDNEWVIAGLLSNKNYQDKKNQLPTNMVLLLVTIVLFILITLPWLKLYQMGSKDRLTIQDGIASVLVSMLLMSLLFFLFFHYNDAFRPSVKTDPKLVIANSIRDNLNSEITTAYRKLEQFDSSVLTKKADIVKLTDSSIAYSNKENKIDSGKQLASIANGLVIKQVFWLDKYGEEIINWTHDSVNSPHGNYKSRLYFRKIMDVQPYVLSNDPSKFFYLDQVISWTTFAFTSVISRKSKLGSKEHPVVACLSFSLNSLDETVLPTGYLFSVIDNTGKVLYHSDKSRNLNENLLTKFSDNGALQSSMEAKSIGTFNTMYYDKKYKIRVEPVKGLPYFIVVFEDSAYDALRVMENYSFTFSMLGLFFAFLVMQLLVIFIVSSKRSFFKKQLFDTSWIGPKKSCQKEYTLSAIMNCIIIFLLMMSFTWHSFLGYLFQLFFSVTFIPLFLTGILARRYKLQNRSTYYFKKVTLYSIALLIVIIDVVAFKILDPANFKSLFFYEISLVLIGFVLYLFRLLFFKWVAKMNGRGRKVVIPKWSYIKSFTFMLLTRLIITSGIPVVFFYISSYNYEKNLNLRYMQADFSKRLLNKYQGKTVADMQKMRNSPSPVYRDGSVIRQLELAPGKKKSVSSYSLEQERAIQLLRQFRLNITEPAMNEDKFYNLGAADSSFAFNHLLDDASRNANVSLMQRQLTGANYFIQIASSSHNYVFPVMARWDFNSLFWLLLVLSLVIFYFIIYTIVNKLFALGLPDIDVWKELDNRIITNKLLNEALFIIGLPGAGKKHYLMEQFKNEAITLNDGSKIFLDEANEESNNAFIAELINIPSSGNEKEEKGTWKKYMKKIFDEKNKLIIVNHFEYNIQDPVSNHYKLDFLERLFLDSKCKIIILSTIHPVAFLDSMNNFIKQDEKLIPGQDLERWHVLLGHYRLVVLPMQLGNYELVEQKSEEATHKILPAQDSTLISTQLILRETNSTHFLKEMQGPIFEVARILDEDKMVNKFDELAFKLQITSHYFYMYIWQSLTKEEKFLLYDLAEDNLVNSFDDYNLSMLLSKGVIERRDGTIKFFNKGFRNFILSAIGNSEAMKIKSQIAENGNWSKLKSPLQIIIIAVLIFLLASQEEAYSKLVTYVAALGAGIPAVLKLFSLFDKGKPKTE